MKTLVRTLFAGTALAMPLAMLVATPAVAADAGTISGNGTITPGLGTALVAQDFSFTGTATTVGTTGVLVDNSCTFGGHDMLGTVAEGVGSFAGNCGASLTFSNCNFVRIVSVVVAACVGGTATIGAGGCVFVPTDQNPTTKFTLTCAVAAA